MLSPMQETQKGPDQPTVATAQPPLRSQVLTAPPVTYKGTSESPATERTAPSAGRSPAATRDRRIIGAWALIVIGLLLLVGNLSRFALFGLLILPALGITFLVWGVLARQRGPLIPAGILTGLGAGILAQQWLYAANDPAGGGVIVLGLGLGFLAITPLTLLVARAWCWWPLIPGTVLAMIGVALQQGDIGLSVLAALGQIWPGILVIVGVFLLWRLSKDSTSRR